MGRLRFYLYAIYRWLWLGDKLNLKPATGGIVKSDQVAMLRYDGHRMVYAPRRVLDRNGDYIDVSTKHG